MVVVTNDELFVYEWVRCNAKVLTPILTRQRLGLFFGCESLGQMQCHHNVQLPMNKKRIIALITKLL